MKRPGVLAIALGALLVPMLLAFVESASYRSANAPTGSIMSLGRVRDFTLHVPRTYDPARATPLVITLHGASLWGSAMRDLSLWNEVADSAGFIVVYPNGIARGPRSWRAVGSQIGDTDVRFIADLIDTLSAHYNIDPARIYANGLSNGGGMSYVLSCTLSNRIAAVGLVGAALLFPADWCRDTTPVPMIVFHGTDDRQAKYNGGTSWLAPRPFLAVTPFVSRAARRNRCKGEPVRSRVTSDVSRKEYVGCAKGASVLFYTIHGGGHTWPGGDRNYLPEWFAGYTTQTISASREMWAFFDAHPLAR